MRALKRTTIYFDPELHRALRLKAAAADRSVSEIVREAVQQALTEDAVDLAAFRVREKEPTLNFDAFVEQLARQ